MSEATAYQQNNGAESALATPTQYLTFRVADETYAVGILQVREILRYETVTKVPTTPMSIRGVLNLRGRVVPVVDLAVRLGLPESAVTKWSCVIIVEVELDGEQTVMGVMVDSVNEVIELLANEIEPPPPFGTQVRVSYLIGMAKCENKFILILDIDEILASEEIMSIPELRQALEADELPEYGEKVAVDSPDEASAEADLVEPELANRGTDADEAAGESSGGQGD
jgi:purine-binding chemotaxis protein CheW